MRSIVDTSNDTVGDNRVVIQNGVISIVKVDSANIQYDDGQNVKIYTWTAAKSSGYVFTLTNTVNPDVTITKVDSTDPDITLAGASFILYKNVSVLDENGDPVTDAGGSPVYDKEYYRYVGAYTGTGSSGDAGEDGDKVTIYVQTWYYNNTGGTTAVEVPSGKDLILSVTQGGGGSITGYEVWDGKGALLGDLSGWTFTLSGDQYLAVTIPADAVEDGLTIVVTGNPNWNFLDVSFTASDPDAAAPVYSNEKRLTVNVYADNELADTYMVYTPAEISVTSAAGDYSVSYCTASESVAGDGSTVTTMTQQSQENISSITFRADGTCAYYQGGQEITDTYAEDTISLYLPVDNDGEIAADYTVEGAPKGTNWVSEDDATVVTTGSDGLAIFRYLEDGTYTIEEIAAPAGYSRLFSTLTFTLEDGVVTSVYIDGQQVSADGNNIVQGGQGTDNSAIVFWNGTDLSIEVANTPAASLPSTGGIGCWEFPVIGLAVMGIAGSALAYRSRKGKKNGLA